MESGNLGQQSAMDETRMQVMLNMYKCAFRMQATEPQNMWAAAKREALRGSPKISAEVPTLLIFVQSMAGADGAILKDLVSFSKTLKRPRVVTGPVLAAIATAVLGEDGFGCIKFRIDVIKAMISASEKHKLWGSSASGIDRQLRTQEKFVQQADT